MGVPLRIGTGPARNGSEPQTAECSPCCGDPPEGQWTQIEACECAVLRYVQVPIGYFSCADGFGFLPLGGTLKMQAIQPGRCWRVLDFFDDLPEGGIELPHTVFEPVCTPFAGCFDETFGCADYSGDCPPPCCGFTICSGLQDFDAARCDYSDRTALVVTLRYEVIVTYSGSFNLTRVALPGHPDHPPGTLMTEEKGTVSGTSTHWARFTANESCQPQCAVNEWRANARADWRLWDIQWEDAIEIDRDDVRTEVGCENPAIPAAQPECGVCYPGRDYKPDVLAGLSTLDAGLVVQSQLYRVMMGYAPSGTPSAIEHDPRCVYEEGWPDVLCVWDDEVVEEIIETRPPGGDGNDGLLRRITTSGRYKRWGAGNTRKLTEGEYTHIESVSGVQRTLTTVNYSASVTKIGRVWFDPCPDSSGSADMSREMMAQIEAYMARGHRCSGCGD